MPRSTFSSPLRLCALVLPALLTASAIGAPLAWVALDQATLDKARGGFSAAGGLELSLGIARLVSINGELVAQTRLALSTTMGTGESALAAMGASARLVQRGEGNLAQSGLPAGVLVQNTLSNQQIATRTVIHASVNSPALLGVIHFQGQLSDALLQAAAPR